MVKKSFTLLELVFVIVVIGIISAAVIPRAKSGSLREAATQLVSHIRYTQHLAMVDDKFNAAVGSEWYKERWMIRFKKDLVFAGSYTPNKTYYGEWSYSIFSDKSDDKHPNPNEIAKNPLDSNKYLSGGYNNTLHVEDEQSMKKLRLGSAYGITDISFAGGCRSNIHYIYFDNIGRPFNSMNTSSSYEVASSGYHKLLTSTCTITLNNNEGSVIIGIEPETGYTKIL